MPQAVVIEAFGDPSVFKLVEFEERSPRPFQVRIRVEHSAVNSIDVGTRVGKLIPPAAALFPMVLGWDCVGTVQEIGPRVDPELDGQRVVVSTAQNKTGLGSYSESLTIDSSHVVPLPDGADPVKAAALPFAGLRALEAIRLLELGPGQSLYINKPHGAVAELVKQIAVDMGVEVRSELNGFVDAGLDVVGGKSAHSAMATVRDGGTYATTCAHWWIPGGPFTTHRGIEPQIVSVQFDQARLRDIVTYFARGVVDPTVDEQLGLDDARTAHEKLESGGGNGRIILSA